MVTWADPRIFEREGGGVDYGISFSFQRDGGPRSKCVIPSPFLANYSDDRGGGSTPGPLSGSATRWYILWSVLAFLKCQHNLEKKSWLPTLLLIQSHGYQLLKENDRLCICYWNNALKRINNVIISDKRYISWWNTLNNGINNV